MRTTKQHERSLEVFILAGGLSSRMGRDKGRIRIGGRSMLRRVRDTASELGFPVRVIRKDMVPRCGPLGGILTALKRSRAETILLLACDMPFVTAALLTKTVRAFSRQPPALFALEEDRAGFPFLLRREISLPVVKRQIELGEFSLQSLAKKLRAKTFRPPRTFAGQLTNINTPEDLNASQQK